MTAVRRRYLLIGLLLFLACWPITFDGRLVLWGLAAYVWLGAA